MWWGKRADPLVVVGKGMEQNLGGYIPAEFRVGSAIDHSHAALAEHLRDTIMRNALAYHRNVPGLMGLS